MSVPGVSSMFGVMLSVAGSSSSEARSSGDGYTSVNTLDLSGRSMGGGSVHGIRSCEMLTTPLHCESKDEKDEALPYLTLSPLSTLSPSFGFNSRSEIFRFSSSVTKTGDL